MSKIEEQKTGSVLYLQKDISQLNASQVKSEWLSIVNISSCNGLWVDVGIVNFIVSVGLGVIATAYSAAKQRAPSLVLCSVNSPACLVFELTGLDQVLELSSTIPTFSVSELGRFDEPIAGQLIHCCAIG